MYAIQKRCEELELFVLRVNENYLNVCQSSSDVFKYANDCWKKELKDALEQIEKAYKNLENVPENNDTKNKFEEAKTVIDSWKDDAPDRKVIKKHIKVYDEINENMKKIKDEHTEEAIIIINANSAQGAAYVAKEVTKEIVHALAPSISGSRSAPTLGSTSTTHTDGPTEKKEIALKYLKERDKHFVKTSVSTLGWFQLWFLFHWVLYMLSTFMILTLLIDAIALHVKAKIDHIDPGVLFDPAEIGFLFMYSLAQCFFLLYPCLRAASVTRTRARVIRHLNEQAHTFTNIPADVMNEFIDSMRKRKFSFRLRILCAQIPFNLNIAYFSIAFGFVGVVVTLITSVKT